MTVMEFVGATMEQPIQQRPRSEQRQRTALVALRMLPSEREALDAAARQRGVSLSEFIRTSALAEIANH